MKWGLFEQTVNSSTWTYKRGKIFHKRPSNPEEQRKKSTTHEMRSMWTVDSSSYSTEIKSLITEITSGKVGTSTYLQKDHTRNKSALLLEGLNKICSTGDPIHNNRPTIENLVFPLSKHKRWLYAKDTGGTQTILLSLAWNSGKGGMKIHSIDLFTFLLRDNIPRLELSQSNIGNR